MDEGLEKGEKSGDDEEFEEIAKPFFLRAKDVPKTKEDGEIYSEDWE